MAEAAEASREQGSLDRLVELLDLERIEQDIFRGLSPASNRQRVFGGQVAGQALVAAGRTVEPDRDVHSLHSYFIRPGDPSVPIVYEVDRVRDGRSFTTRRVVAVQHGKPIFTLSASFQLEQPGIEHGATMPDVPDPDELPGLDERLVDAPAGVSLLAGGPRPIDVRYVDDPPWHKRARVPNDEPYRIWIRANGSLPDDPLLHVCVLTYASDMSLLDSVLIRHGLAMGIDELTMASLDHAMWFRGRVRADEWVLYSMNSPSASGGRGLGTGRFFDRDGRHLGSVVQEGMIRVRTS